MLFYINKIVHSALYTFINNNPINRDLLIVNLFVELVIIGYMLFTFRSRKWPEYFSLDILYQRIGDGDNAQDQLPKSIILNAIVPAPWVANHSSCDVTLNGNEVRNYIPNKYKEAEVALILESADQEAQNISKMNESEFKSNVYSDIKMAVEENLSDYSDNDL